MLQLKLQQFLIDIHGQGKVASTIFIGTQNKQTIKRLFDANKKNVLEELKDNLETLHSKGYKIFPSLDNYQKEHQSYDGGFTVGNYGSHNKNGINTIQLEFGWNLRCLGNIDQTAKVLSDATAIFIKNQNT